MNPSTAEQAEKAGGAEPSDAELVLLARSGDATAWEQILRRHLRMLGRVARRHGGAAVDPDDLVQDSVLEAMRSLDELLTPQSLGAWLVGILRRKALFGFRRARVRRRLEEEMRSSLEAWSGSKSSTDTGVQLREVETCLAAMPDQLGQAVVLRRVEGLKLKEVAAELDTSLATTKRWLDQAEVYLARVA